MLRRFYSITICLMIMLFTSVNVNAESVATSTIIKGIVRDSISHAPVPFTAIFFEGSEKGLLTNENGEFNMTTPVDFNCLNVSVLGYKEKKVIIEKGKLNELVIDLIPSGVKLNEVVVNQKKDKYSKKNNPSVIFMKKIREKKNDFDPHNHSFYTFDKHTKINLALNDFIENEKSLLMTNKLNFIFDYIDTSEISGKPVLNVFIKEKLSTQYYKKSPKTEKEYIRALKSDGIDKSFESDNIQRFFEDVLREIDIYNNDITIMQNRFVSPLSNIGENFYKYYLTDTVLIEGEQCVELSFVPFTPESFGFTGRIYVLKDDTTMFIKRVKLNVPKAINLNYVESIYINQDFKKDSNGNRLKMSDDMSVEFKILPTVQGLYAHRLTKYNNHKLDTLQNEEIFLKEGNSIVAENAQYMPNEFWRDNRIIPLKYSESRVGRMFEQLREVPVYYWTEKILTALVTGYVPTKRIDSKFDFGPMNSVISGNQIEGVRLRVGGMTTANLNKHLFARGYVAYGFKDEKLKYKAELEYSFNEKKYHSKEFPIHSIKASHSYDVDQIGQRYSFTNPDNVFLTLKRQDNNKMTYLRSSNLQYTLETHSGFSVEAGFSYNTQEATYWLPFIDGYGISYKNYNEAILNLKLRYAPGEKFYQTNTERIPINLDAPVFILSQSFAPKGFLRSKNTINKTEFCVQKRFWFSAFGYTDIILKAGKIWSEVNYPDLLIPNANLSYTIQPESYALMNAFEFANDQYLSWDLTYWANGALFNRIPFIKYLKLREVFTFRGLYGSLTDKNNPELNNSLFRFPEITKCRSMGKKPYMEIGVGIDNIFTILRIDYVWRLTYRDLPGINKSGLRVQLHFTF